MKALLPLAAVTMLAACGSAADLKPAKGAALPLAPYGAAATPTAMSLLTPST
jgi:hypothetical protein